MDMREIRVRLILRELGIPITGTHENYRIIKFALYLAQAAGVDCDHYFHWSPAGEVVMSTIGEL